MTAAPSLRAETRRHLPYLLFFAGQIIDFVGRHGPRLPYGRKMPVLAAAVLLSLAIFVGLVRAVNGPDRIRNAVAASLAAVFHLGQTYLFFLMAKTSLLVAGPGAVLGLADQLSVALERNVEAFFWFGNANLASLAAVLVAGPLVLVVRQRRGRRASHNNAASNQTPADAVL